MKKVLILLLIFAAGCAPAFDYDAMAIEMCACLKPMSDVSEQIEIAAEGSDTLLFKQLLQKIEVVAAQSDSCANVLYEKYGDIAPENEEKAQSALMKACPIIMKKMNY